MLNDQAIVLPPTRDIASLDLGSCRITATSQYNITEQSMRFEEEQIQWSNSYSVMKRHCHFIQRPPTFVAATSQSLPSYLLANDHLAS